MGTQMYLFKEYADNFYYKDLEFIAQVYHSWDKWEDYKYGFYDNISGKNKKEMIEKVILFFEDYNLTEEYMNKVIKEWKYSCEHNFTNPSINKIAYLGQSALSLAYKIPSTVTMEAWSKIDKTHRDKADTIADNCINEWFKNYLLCQNKD
jgi:hypothetical protein